MCLRYTSNMKKNEVVRKNRIRRMTMAIILLAIISVQLLLFFSYGSFITEESLIYLVTTLVAGAGIVAALITMRFEKSLKILATVSLLGSLLFALYVIIALSIKFTV